MAEVQADVEEIELPGDNGGYIPGLKVICSKCDHTVEVFGTSDRSARRGAVMLAEECPCGERNFYVVDWDG